MRPIDADALKADVEKSMNLCALMGGSVAPLAMVIDYINAAPTVAAAPEPASDCDTCGRCPGCIYHKSAMRRVNCPLWRAKG